MGSEEEIFPLSRRQTGSVGPGHFFPLDLYGPSSVPEYFGELTEVLIEAPAYLCDKSDLAF